MTLRTKLNSSEGGTSGPFKSSSLTTSITFTSGHATRSGFLILLRLQESQRMTLAISPMQSWRKLKRAIPLKTSSRAPSRAVKSSQNWLMPSKITRMVSRRWLALTSRPQRQSSVTHLPLLMLLFVRPPSRTPTLPHSSNFGR